MLKKLILLFHTLRYLKPIQFYWRVYLKIIRFLPFSTDINQRVQTRHLKLLPVIAKQNSFADGRFTFLNASKIATFPNHWNAPDISKLWLYNLHYFDYLNQQRIERAVSLALMTDWINHNPTGKGNGWEPYTLSLRIVNWIKYLVGFEKTDDSTRFDESLFLQTRFLYRHLEYHLLGNHLFKNGVALLYAGNYFQGDEAQAWLNKGLQIISQQIREQILPDGGHFERSPMYHALILEDILDCLNLDLSTHYLSQAELSFISAKAKDMLAFLAAITHQDGEIPLFNDSALKIASTPDDIFTYAASLGLKESSTAIVDVADLPMTVIEKPDFGLYVLQNKQGRMIVDAGVIGPDYLPGHAHCDTLSYELSIAGRRCIVNSGTYQYAGAYRNHFRATAAHNTVRIDSKEQHEIWSTFRVARRGYPFDIKLLKEPDFVRFSAAHSGYSRLKNHPIHRREIFCGSKSWEIRDHIEGSGTHQVESFIHLHPDVRILEQSFSHIKCAMSDSIFSLVALEDAKFEIEVGHYSPEFGIKTENKVVVLRKQGLAPLALSYQIIIV